MGVGNDKLVFFHVPKAGGTWAIEAMQAAGVELAPERADRHHLRLAECDLRGRFAFAFVREPLSWYGSTYNFRRREFWGDDALPFPVWIERIVRFQPGRLMSLYETFVGPPEAEIDFIGRFETLADDLVRSLREAGQEFDEQALRGYPPVNLSAPLPPCPSDLKRELMRSEMKVYERFYPDRVSDLLSRA